MDVDDGRQEILESEGDQLQSDLQRRNRNYCDLGRGKVRLKKLCISYLKIFNFHMHTHDGSGSYVRKMLRLLVS